MPQLEARLSAGRTVADDVPVDAFIAGHWDRKDLDGAGVDGDATLDGWAVNGGVRLRPGPFTIIGNAYVGHAVGQLFASTRRGWNGTG